MGISNVRFSSWQRMCCFIPLPQKSLPVSCDQLSLSQQSKIRNTYWYQESVFVVKIMLFLSFLLTQSHWCIQDAIEHQPLPVGCDAIKWNIDFLGIPVYVDIVGKKNSNVSENLQVIQLCTYRDFIFNHWHHKNIQCFKYKVTLWFCGAWIISIAKLHWHGY